MQDLIGVMMHFKQTLTLVENKLTSVFKMIRHNIYWNISCTQLYLNGLEWAAEQHVVGGDQCAYRVVMGTDSIDFLQGLDVPHLRSSNAQQKEKNTTCIDAHN